MRKALTLLAAGLVAASASAEPPALDVEAFLRRHPDDFIGIMSHPQVECLLESFVPTERLDALKELLHRRQGSAGLEKMDATGGLTFEGWFPGAACQRAVLWIHPDGRIVGGDDQCDGVLRAWTNDAGLRASLPPGVVSWMNGEHQWTSRLEWIAPVPAVRVPRSCTRRALQSAIDDLDARLDERLCDAKVGFFGNLAVVRPRTGQTAPLSRRGEARLAAVAPMRKPYLVTGDLVERAFTREECTCVRFEGRKGVVAGWIAAADLEPLPAGLPQEVKWTNEQITAFAAALPPATRFEDLSGLYEARSSSLDVRRRSDGHFEVRTVGGIQEDPLGELRGLDRLDAGTWLVDDEGDVPCQMILRQYNNALAVHENGWCGDRYGWYDDIYFPASLREEPAATRGKP